MDCFDNAQRLGMRSPELLEEKARALEQLGEDERAEEVAEEAQELRADAERAMLDE